MPDFLLEIGCEEIPARMLSQAESELARRIVELLVRESLFTPPASEVASIFFDPEFVEQFSTPRRVAVLVHHIALSQPDVTQEVIGPSWKIAFKDGTPTPAVLAFAKKVGVDVSDLNKVSTAKGEYVAARVTTKGRRAENVLANSLPREIAGVYWAKNMYWREGKPERFVRPIRWLVAMIDAMTIPLEFAGIRAGRITRGHRILGPEAVEISSASSYEDTLFNAKVNVDYRDRHSEIAGMLSQAPASVGAARDDEDLLETVTNLVEWPSVILGNFDKDYLSLPEEVLVTVMRDHQKYFAVEDGSGKLAPHFLAVLNTDGDPAGLIRHGNERVLRARFNDARFFWNTDQKIPLPERVEMLKSVTFQKDLGSYYDKTQRIAALATNIAALLRKSGEVAEHDAVYIAALFAKADLTTELVKEFTELQGIIGGLYVRAQGIHGRENDSHFAQRVANAIYDQYKPESTEDSVARSVEGAVLSIADKADSIVGLFGLRLIPSGSSDPFALRRQANGIVKTLAERKLEIRLSTVIEAAVDQYASHARTDFGSLQQYKARLRHVLSGFKPVEGVISPGDEIAKFFVERIQFYLRDVLGLAYDVVNATLAVDADDVVDAIARASAVAKVRALADFEAISTSFKRMKNILRQAAESEKRVAEPPLDPSALRQQEEITLNGLVRIIAREVKELSASKKYDQALVKISKLRPAVDAFFDKVMVMVDDEDLRAQRLGLLKTLLDEFSSIADFSEIVTEKK